MYLIMLLQARIDSHNKVLYARHADLRNATFQRALENGRDFDRDLQCMFLRSCLLKYECSKSRIRRLWSWNYHNWTKFFCLFWFIGIDIDWGSILKLEEYLLCLFLDCQGGKRTFVQSVTNILWRTCIWCLVLSRDVYIQINSNIKCKLI